MLADKTVLLIFGFLFILLNNFSVTFSLKNKDVPCQQLGLCKCLFPTGRGINLNPVNQNLSAVISPSTRILLHLCENVGFGTPSNTTYYNQCSNNVSICYIDDSKNQSLSLGKAENLTFITLYEHQPEPFSVQFHNGENTTNILLLCDENADVPKLDVKTVEGSTYNLQLSSKQVCIHLFTPEEGPPGALSIGSVLVIMLLVFTLVYFVGGMLTLRLLRGAEGREMIPNIDFWMDLPYLVRDGVLFTLNGCRPPASYDRI
uniref:Mannose-6-phosphate receptor domain-containing protein n=1 Tax=Cuerna arida TaxID=1464854 RepID=A0A1B6GPE9_9HEMI